MKKDVDSAGRVKFYVDRQSSAIKTAVILVLISAIFRFIGSWGLWNDREFMFIQLILPLICCFMFVGIVILLGGKALWLSAVPVILGAVFFIVNSLDFPSLLRTVLSIIFYIAVAMLYTATVFGFIGNKWFLLPAFALPFLYNIFFVDVAALRNTEEPVTFSAGMLEMSVLCILLALFCTSAAMKKRGLKADEDKLPKIKDPVIIPAGQSEDKNDEKTAEPEPVKSEPAEDCSKQGDKI